MGKGITQWVFQRTNWRDLTQKDLDMAKKGKYQEINSSSNSSKKQHYKDQIYSSEY